MNRKVLPRLLLASTLSIVAAGASAGVNSWTSLNAPAERARTVAVHPVDPNILFTSTYEEGPPNTYTAKVYRTINGGASWDLVFSAPTAAVEQILIDPVNPSTVWAVRANFTDGAGGATVYRSVNGGTDWELKNFGLIAKAEGMAADASSLGTLYARTDQGIYKTTNNGDSWASVSSAIAQSIAVDPANGNVFAVRIPV